MRCDELLSRLGYECHEAGSDTLVVDTPFSFPGGEPIGFYLRETADFVTVHDNADTLAHLEGIGIDLSSRVRWRGIKNTVAAFGFDLEDSGIITATSSKGLEYRLVSNYIGALLAISDIEREHMGLTEEQVGGDE